MSIFKSITALLLAAVLASCGGGGGNASTPSSSGTTSTSGLTPASLEIVGSSNTLSTGANASVSFVVAVKDSNNVAIPNQSVTFTADSGTLTGASPTPVTNANGVITSVSLSAGADVSNRTITVTAKAGDVTKTYSIVVAGSNLSIAGVGSMLLNSSTKQYTVKATDSSGKPIGNASLTVTSSLGNVTTGTTVTTNPSSGTAIVSYTPSNVGSDTLTVTGLGATSSIPVTVSNQDFSVTAIPAIGVGVSTAVTATYKNAGVGVPGQTVSFSTNRGTLSSPTAVTNASGVATVNISSTSAGSFTLIAQVGSATASASSSFVATVPATIVLQTNPATVQPNTDGGSTNQSALSVLVQDANGNPVPSQGVNFSLMQDASGGSISPGSSTTDLLGRATVQFIPGPLSTATNGVSVKATLASNASISSTANLTVNGSALFITIGIANTLVALNSTTYAKEFTVYVTDSSGAPVTGKQVSLSSIPRQYGKGSLVYGGTPTKWNYSSTSPTLCANEDTNQNGTLDSGEDTNGNGILDPGNPAALIPISAVVTTDQYGFANFSIRYGKNFAYWISTDLSARASVGGTESKKTITYSFEMLTDDATAPSTPPNALSPFGVATSCSNPN